MLGFTLLALLSTAHAQSVSEDYSFNLELFHPAPDFYGYSAVQGAGSLGNLQLGVGAWFDFQNDPLVLEYGGQRVAVVTNSATPEKGDGVVDSRFTANMHLGMGFTKYVSLTVDFPFILAGDAYDLTGLSQPSGAATAVSNVMTSDMRVQVKVTPLDRSQSPVALAFAIPVSLPTCTATAYNCEEGLIIAPTAIAEFSDGEVEEREHKFRTAVNLGYGVRTGAARIRDVNVGSAFLYGLGIGVHPATILEITGEFHGSSFGDRAAQHPAEALLGLKLLPGRWFTLSAGGGVGVLGGIGAPDYRAYFGVEGAPSFDPNARDTDEDAIPDGMDKCPKDAEDADGFADTDGCPELDNDADGREDGVDKCPDDPEDDDGYLDNDGCPDNDNDKDSIGDSADRCPDQAETVNGFEDDDGCPDEKPVDDSDGDGYKDDIDRCPYDGEDLDNFEDEDGCPDKDNDGDAIADAQDKCPDVREVFNGTDDDDGCPDEASRVVIEKDSIKITDVIYFDTGKATIQSRSFDLLDEIAKVMVDHPELLKIRVEGHTDSDGNDAANLKLSQARAQSVVDYLVSHGVDKGRLDPRGFGETSPIAENTTKEGKEKNRRVEFIIVDRK